LYSNKGLNLPGRSISIPTLTEKDHADLEFAARAGIDLVAISFVRSPEDIRLARALLGSANAPIMAKLERPEALDALDEILEVSDGIMVARGDLGVELPFQDVPVLQKKILVRARALGKWAVVATQMLGSMVLSHRPTRAEASDVVNAVLDGADAVMLSEESATGVDPANAVRAMASLAQNAEQHERQSPRNRAADEQTSFSAGVAISAVSSAEHIDARAIVTLAGSGYTALQLSKRRPRIPIIALGSYDPTLRRLAVLHGVIPLGIQNRVDFEAQVETADAFLLEKNLVKVGDVVVVAAAIPLGQHKEPNTIRFHRVRAGGGPSIPAPAIRSPLSE
jgi:pyruvate kinase